MSAVRHACTVVVVVCAVLLAVTAAGAVTGRWRVVPVLSGSMEPALPAGSAAVAVPAAAASVEAGDIIVFHAPIADRPALIHRVTEVVEGGVRPVVRTGGDASARPDPWTARLEGPVVWKVRRVLPGAGYVAVAAQDRSVRMAIAAAVGAVASVLALGRLLRPRATGARPSIA